LCSFVYFLSSFFFEICRAKFSKISGIGKILIPGGSIEAGMVSGARARCHRGKAAIFRIMESTMAYRGFWRASFDFARNKLRSRLPKLSDARVKYLWAFYLVKSPSRRRLEAYHGFSTPLWDFAAESASEPGFA